MMTKGTVMAIDGAMPKRRCFLKDRTSRTINGTIDIAEYSINSHLVNGIRRILSENRMS
jgi:hypothetical protein